MKWLCCAFVVGVLTLSCSLSAFDTLPTRNPMPNISEVRDVVGMWAEIDASEPSITLRFLYAGDYEVYRRLSGETGWGAALTTSTGTDSESYTDTTVTPGVVYEYAAKKVSAHDYGYIRAGIDVDAAGPRGTLILVVAENIVTGNEARLQTLLADLVGDGWKVRTIMTPVFVDNAYQYDNNGSNGVYSYDYARELRNQIRCIYEEESDAKMIYFLGHTPLAQSGTSVYHPDGHGNRTSYVTDFFYADIDGVWTDNAYSQANPGPSGELSLPNLPGDGIYDPSRMPSMLELAFGRVDPVDCDTGGSVNTTDTHTETHAETVGIYLDKSHKYKNYQPYGQPGAETLIGRRAILRHSNGGQNGASALAVQFLSIFGLHNLEDFHTSSTEPQYLIDNGPFLYYGQNSQGPTGAAPGEKGAHRYGMQSWWGDWWSRTGSRENIFGSENMSLTWIYSGRWDTQFLLFPLGMNETYGEALRLSANYEWEEYFTGNITTSSFYERREFLRNLVGDPTLRMFPVPPPQNLTATPNGANVALAWDTPVDVTEFVEYRVFRSNSLLGDFTQLASGLTGTTFTDTNAPTGPKVYMVQAIHDVTTGSGNFLNNSQGVFAKVGLSIDQFILPGFPAGSDVDFDLTVTDANGSATWSLISGTLPPGLELSSAGKLSGNPVSPGEYRVTLQVVDDDNVPIQQEYSIWIDGDLTEIVSLDLRGDGFGRTDKTQFDRTFTVWGDPVTEVDGTVFDGDDDAIQIHDMGEGNSVFPDYDMLPYARYRSWSIVVSFKADPTSDGGILLSRAQNLDGSWGANKTNWAVRMTSDGKVIGQMATRRVTSGAGYNDGQWHQAVFKSNGNFFVDNNFIGSLNPASKSMPEDILIGARWDGAGGTTITDEFDGALRDIKIYNSPISSSEVSALYDRFSRSRNDITPNAPSISALPSTILADPDQLATGIRTPFNASDPDGEPIKFVMKPLDRQKITHYEIIKASSGYELFVQVADIDGAPAQFMLAAEDGWPGHSDIHVIDFVFTGGQDDYFAVGIDGGRLDVLANDIPTHGNTLTLVSITSPPSQGHASVEDGEIVFYPPINWNTPVSLQYELRFNPSGLTQTINVNISPSNLPTPVADTAPTSGSSSVLIDVLANDSDPLDETLEVVSVQQPANGSARIVGGRIEYTPANGQDSPLNEFCYTVRNESGFTASAVISVTTSGGSATPAVELLLNEGSGASAANSGALGSTANGVINGAASWVSGIQGDALYFDGSSNYIDLGNPAGLNFNPANDSFSIVMAVKFDISTNARQNYYTLLSKENDAGDTQFSLVVGPPPGETNSIYAGAIPHLKDEAFTPYYEPLKASFNFENAFYWRYIDDDESFNDEDWRIVTVINDADIDQLRVYVDGWQVIKIPTGSYDFDQGDNGANWLIGARPDGSGGQTDFFHGTMDNIRIYSRAISPVEIKPALQAAGLVADIMPVNEVVSFTPGATSTFTTGVTYTFTPRYDDPDSPPDEAYVRWQVVNPSNVNSYAYSRILERSFDQEGVWRIRYDLHSEANAYRYVTTDYIDLTVGPTDNIILPLELGENELFSEVAGEPVSITFTATGGTPPYTFSFAGGALPSGLTVNTDGTITGTTTQQGLYNFSVNVSDDSDGSDTANYQLLVSPADSDEDGMPDDWETSVFGGIGMSPGDEDDAGVSAIIRFALGANSGLPADFPFIMRGSKGPQENGDDKYFVIQFQRRRDLTGHTVSAKCSTDLSTWNDVNETPVVIGDDGEFETLELRVPRAGDEQKFFLISVQ